MTPPPTSEQIRQQIHGRLPHLAGLLEPHTRLDHWQLDSLDTMELLMVLDELYGVRLAREDMRQVATVGQFAELIAARRTTRSVAQP